VKPLNTQALELLKATRDLLNNTDADAFEANALNARIEAFLGPDEDEPCTHDDRECGHCIDCGENVGIGDVFRSDDE
jgi:predicted aldo/keto reductase-like oxidoreductase